MKKRLLLLAWIILLCCLCGACAAEEPALSLSAADTPPIEETLPQQEAEPPAQAETQPQAIRISLVAVGDNLLHLPIVRWCKTGSGYDFTPLYRQVKDLVQAADMAFVNQESPLGGQGFQPSGYPTFNSPQEAGQALAETGFTVVSQANNHALDQGAKAVLATAEFWQQQEGITAIGINRSAEERAEITVTEVSGYRFAWLAYSYGTNGMPMRDDYLLNLIDREAMAADIAQAREQADAVIVSMHWGNEYQLRQNREQEELAQFLADQGVLLIIGHHPHVIQPLEWLTGRQGNETLVVYSLGNFISNQAQRDTMLEGMLSVIFVADEQGVAIEGVGVIPLVMHYESGYTNYGVYPLYTYTEELARRHYINVLDKAISLAWLDELSAEIWGEARILSPEQKVAVIPQAMPQGLAAGGAHALLVQRNGTLWGWGRNEYGALGSPESGLLAPHQMMEQVQSVSAGSRHTLALQRDGTLWAWGRNHVGQLGDGTLQDRAEPVQILSGVKAISSGDWHSLALLQDGTLWAWGFNHYGQLGDGTTADRALPVKIMEEVALIAAGTDGSAAVKTDGSLWLWGRNHFGQLGCGDTQNRTNPVQVLEDVVSVSVRDWHSAAIKADGSLWAWGRNHHGQLGDGSTTNSLLPLQVRDGMAAVSVGRTFTLALQREGSLWSWGDNAQGQLGGAPGQPVLQQVMEICAGSAYALARQADGSVWAWGNNDHGQLGTLQEGSLDRPRLVLRP